MRTTIKESRHGHARQPERSTQELAPSMGRPRAGTPDQTGYEMSMQGGPTTCCARGADPVISNWGRCRPPYWNTYPKRGTRTYIQDNLWPAPDNLYSKRQDAPKEPILAEVSDEPEKQLQTSGDRHAKSVIHNKAKRSRRHLGQRCISDMRMSREPG